MTSCNKATRSPRRDTITAHVFAVWLVGCGGVISHSQAKAVYDDVAKVRGGGGPEYTGLNVTRILRRYGRKTQTRIWNRITRRWNRAWVMDDRWLEDACRPTTYEQVRAHIDDEVVARRQVMSEQACQTKV